MTPRAERGALARTLAAAPPERRPALLLRELQVQAAAFLQLPSADAVAADVAWAELGFDSLRAVDFRSTLEHLLDRELRSTLLFDLPTPALLVAHLVEAEPPAVPIDPGARPRVPIAIVGAACRFPGAADLAAFDRLLRDGVDAITEVPDGRWDLARLYDPDPDAPGRIYVRHGGFLQQLDRFDAAFFGISPKEALLLDPQQRLLLEVTWHALEHANLPPARLAGLRTGVYIGTRASEYFFAESDAAPADATAYYATGNAVSTAAGRLSYTLGLTGPCYALDTACSGSLVAVHVAVAAIRAGECDAALAGGVNALIDPLSTIGLCRARMLAADGRCKSFADGADGYARGEGCGMVVLRPLADALADGDRVLAVIRGSAINQDGRSGGLTVPHGPSQSAVIRAALADAGLAPGDIDYVEAHGTGTALGDPIEIAALDAVFAPERRRPLWIGSVKTNLGHLESAAGISGLLKTVLALQRRRLPRHLHCQRPSRHVDWERSCTRIVQDDQPWPVAGDLPRAGVSSFGFSGTNCHVVVEGPPAATPRRVAPANATPNGPWLLPLQAADAAALRELAGRWADHLADGDDADLAALCHTAAAGRAPLPHRAAFLAAGRDDLARRLRAFAAGDETAALATGQTGAAPATVALLCTGQGAQRAGMGAELYREQPTFRAAIDRAAAVLDPLLPAPLRSILWGEHTELLDRTDCTQPALVAFELALLELWRGLGIAPVAVLGHSVGDFTAAVAAGVMDAADALRACAERGRLMQAHCRPGGMLAVLAAQDRWRDLLPRHPELGLAVDNADDNAVVAGPVAALRALAEALARQEVPARLLPVSHAFHCAATEPVLAPFAAWLAGIALRPPRCEFLTVGDGTPDTAAWWVRHVRAPVRFRAGLAALRELRWDLCLELGPAPVLTALAAGQGIPRQRLVPGLRPRHGERVAVLEAAARLWCRGAPLDLVAANGTADCPRVPLPAYPFQRRRFWLQRSGRRDDDAGGAGGHPLLGGTCATSLLQPGQLLFRRTLSQRDPGWLADHRVLGGVLVPMAAMLECALAGVAAALERRDVRLSGVALRAPLPLLATGTALEVLAGPAAAESATVPVALRSLPAQASVWNEHLQGHGTAAPAARPAPVDLDAIRARCGAPADATAHYRRCAALQLDYGPAFRTVRELTARSGEVLGRVRLPDELAAAGFYLHPALLDGCLQLAVAAMPDDGGTFLPLGLDQLTVWEPPGAEAWCHASLRLPSAGAARSMDARICDAAGRVLAELAGLRLVPADPATLAAAASHAAPRDLLHHVAWEPLPAGQGAGPARVLAVAAGPWSAPLAAALAGCEVRHAAAADVAAALAAAPVDAILHLGAAAADHGAPHAALQRLLRSAQATARAATAAPETPRLYFVTRGAVAHGAAMAPVAPTATALAGFARALAAEQPALRVACLDLEPGGDDAAALAGLAEALRADPAERQLALRRGALLGARLRRGDADAGALPVPPGPHHLRTEQYGSFDRLRLLPLATPTPGAGEIVLRVLAAGLNFKDVLHAMGMLQEHSRLAGITAAAQQPLGFECCGRVLARGPGVDTPAEGSLVLALTPGCLGSRVTVAADAVLPLPADLPPAQAAGLGIVFATALHALEDLARVGPGDTMLLHAAAGGVGLAALQVARRAGARVLATASAHKRPLLRALGIEVVGDTRSKDFVAGVRAATDGHGVDVVLNTLTDAAVPRSLEVLRQGGRFVELGKLGVWDAAQVAAVRPDVRFFAFDLGDVFAAEPGRQRDLLHRLGQGIADGTLRPLPATVFALQHAPAAFAHMARGEHVGKLVLLPPAEPAAAAPGAWLVTGGTGAVGRALLRELVRRGARHLWVLSRGGGDHADFAALRSAGATLHSLACDVADRAALAAALARVRRDGPPLGGVVHLAGVLADAMVADLDWREAAAVLAPKVAGAVHLDLLTRSDPLHTFLLASSMAALLGNAGQSVYAAANAFLDGLAADRRSRGLPATSVALGPWRGDGMAGRLAPALQARLRGMGIGQLEPDAGARWLLDLAAGLAPAPALLPVDWPAFQRSRGGAVPALLRDLMPGAAATTAATADGFVRRLRAAPAAERPALLRELVLREVAAVLGFASARQLDAERSFRELGVDSLLAVDARNRLERALGLQLPATLLFDHPAADALATHLAQQLADPRAGPVDLVATAVDASATADGRKSSVQDAHAADHADLDQLDADALAQRLAAQVRAMEQRP